MCSMKSRKFVEFPDNVFLMERRRGRESDCDGRGVGARHTPATPETPARRPPISGLTGYRGAGSWTVHITTPNCPFLPTYGMACCTWIMEKIGLGTLEFRCSGNGEMSIFRVEQLRTNLFSFKNRKLSWIINLSSWELCPSLHHHLSISSNFLKRKWNFVL